MFEFLKLLSCMPYWYYVALRIDQILALNNSVELKVVKN